MSETSVDTYIKNSFQQGKSREEITANLRMSGWSDEMINSSFSRVATSNQSTYIAPVETPENGLVTFLFVLLFISLFVAVWGFISSSFGFIDMASGKHIMEYEKNGLRWSLAWFVVSFSVFLISNHFLKKVGTTIGSEFHLTGTRKTFTYLTIIFATLTLIGSAVGAVYQLTGGELYSLLKVLVVALAGGAVFGYYFGDVKSDIEKSLRDKKRAQN